MLERPQYQSNTATHSGTKAGISLNYMVLGRTNLVLWPMGRTAGENIPDAFVVFPWHKAITNNSSGYRSSLLTHSNWQRK